jgi:tetratricopeptide (TPR) repeat protein
MNSCCLFLAMSLASADPSSSSADRAYEAGLTARADSAQARVHFLDAASQYEEIWKNEPRADAAQNLAQSYLLAGDPGRAIHAYRRGLQVFPFDTTLYRGLQYARERIEYPDELHPVARVATPTSPFAHWPLVVPLALLTLLYLYGWGWLLYAWKTVRSDWWIGLAAIAISLGLGTWLYFEARHWRSNWEGSGAVVVGTGSDLWTGNSSEYPKKFTYPLPPGTELRLLNERGGWLQVELANKQVGWLPRERVLVVE